MDATRTRALDEPVVDDGIRWLNFFNGRALSAEDLRIDHEAIQRSRAQLGRGLGTGIATGFGVGNTFGVSTAARPVLTVEPGLAFNPSGQAIELQRNVTVGLVRIDAPTSEVGSTFEACDVVLAGTTGLGAYILSVGPADASKGTAPVNGLGNEGAACNTAYSVEGVRFRLTPVPIDTGDVDAPDLRNRLAYRMFGQADPARLARVREPFAASDGPYGDVDNVLGECFASDVALAMLFWQPGDGLRFVDKWSVRRRATPPAPSTTHATPQPDRMAADAEARFLQFEDHIGDLGGTLDSIVARDVFRFLPPAGIVPMPTTISYQTFFRGLKVRRPVWIEGAHLEALLRESLAYPAIGADSDEAIWLYVVRENAQRPRRRPIFDLGLGGLGSIREVALAARLNLSASRVSLGGAGNVGLPAGQTTVQLTPSCVIFTTGHMRYRGDARFDLAYYDFANYAEID